MFESKTACFNGRAYEKYSKSMFFCKLKLTSPCFVPSHATGFNVVLPMFTRWLGNVHTPSKRAPTRRAPYQELGFMLDPVYIRIRMILRKNPGAWRDQKGLFYDDHLCSTTFERGKTTTKRDINVITWVECVPVVISMPNVQCATLYTCSASVRHVVRFTTPFIRLFFRPDHFWKMW